MWSRRWASLSPLFGCPQGIRRPICTARGVESLRGTLRHTIKTRASAFGEELAQKLLCLALENVAQRGKDTPDWRTVLNRLLPCHCGCIKVDLQRLSRQRQGRAIVLRPVQLRGRNRWLPSKQPCGCASTSLAWKSRIQALDRTQPLLPIRPGQAGRRPYDYERHGPPSLFTALDGKTGQLIGARHRRRRAVEFRKFLDTIGAAVLQRFDVQLVLNNHGAHKTPMIPRWLEKRPHFRLRVTPIGALWINQGERRFALLTEKRLRRSACCGTRELGAAIRADAEQHNQQPKPFRWTRTAKDISASAARFCRRTLHTGH